MTRWGRGAVASDARGLNGATGGARAGAGGFRGHLRRRGAVGVDVELANGRAHLDSVALAHEQLGDDAVYGARQLDQGLRRLDLDERLVHLDAVTHGDSPRDDVGLGETLTRIGQRKLLKDRHEFS